MHAGVAAHLQLVEWPRNKFLFGMEQISPRLLSTGDKPVNETSLKQIIHHVLSSSQAIRRVQVQPESEVGLSD